MRKLMWFTVGFTAACAAGVYLLSGHWLLLMGLFCLLGGVIAWFLHTQPAKIAAVILLGCGIGFGWLWGYAGIYLSHAKVMDAQTTELTVTASDYSYSHTYGQAFDGYAELDGKRYRVRCYLNEDRKVTPGTTVSGEFTLRYTAKGGEREPTYHQGKGIFLLASQKSEVIITVGEPQWTDYPAIWRQKIIGCMERIFPADTAGFAKALLLGDTTGFSYRQDRDFQVSGLRHVVGVN